MAEDTSTTGLTYDDLTGETASSETAVQRWNRECGGTFWAVSKAYDWERLTGRVKVCTGSVCKNDQDGGIVCNNKCQDDPSHCKFDFNMYAAILTYSSQLRVANIMTDVYDGSVRERLNETRAHLDDVLDGMTAYKRALSNHKAEDLVDTQIATIQWASHRVGLPPANIQGNFTGFVPSFNLRFHQEQLGIYFQNFGTIVKDLKTSNTFKNIYEIIKKWNRIHEDEEESIVEASIKQTIQTIESAANGMTGALASIRRLNESITLAGFAFQDSLDEYRSQMRKQLVWKVVFGVANLCTGGPRAIIGMFGKGDTDWNKKTGGDFWKEALFSVEQFANHITGTAIAGIALTKANSEHKFPNSTVELTEKMLKELERSGVPIARGDIADGEAMATLQTALDNMNTELPKMGWGYWTEYLANMKKSYNPYLTGYTPTVNAAAQHIVDLVTAQKDYGALPSLIPSHHR